MCGHGTIGTVTAAIEEGLVQPRDEGRMAIEAPAGKITIEYTKVGQYVEAGFGYTMLRATCTSPASISRFPGWETLEVDLAYGGNYYVIIEPQASWAGARCDGLRARSSE